ncbi:protein phosphatase 2C domain-containing protein [Nonomuraea polychroma]|uniref:protein phosphatase 2C domain-containing protein n=1 Tax=Nonomuraea polychroma TaxID=46176 RepID=UPI003D8CA2C6
MANDRDQSGKFAVGDRALCDDVSPHPDWSAGYGEAGRYCIIGASALGRLHAHQGTPRDDAFAAHANGQWLAAAVADGVGSRPLSRYGAALCAERLCHHLLRTISQESRDNPTTDLDDTHVRSGSGQDSSGTSPEPTNSAQSQFGWNPFSDIVLPAEPTDDDIAGHAATLVWTRRNLDQNSPTTASDDGSADLQALVRAAFAATRSDLDDYAARRNLTPGDLACTLLGVVLEVETGSGAAGHIGDGEIALIDMVHGPRPLVTPPVPETPGAAYSISNRGWANHLATASFAAAPGKPAPSVLLMTDGVSVDCLHPPPENAYEKACNAIHEQLSGLPPGYTALKLVHWLATYMVRGSFDDRTLVALLSKNGNTQPAMSTWDSEGEPTPESGTVGESTGATPEISP